MSRYEKVGEAVSVLISLVNNQHSCLVEFLDYHQFTEILENFFFLTFYFWSVSKNTFCFNVF